jgi:hypothetical protein
MTQTMYAYVTIWIINFFLKSLSRPKHRKSERPQYSIVTNRQVIQEKDQQRNFRTHRPDGNIRHQQSIPFNYLARHIFHLLMEICPKQMIF